MNAAFSPNPETCLPSSKSLYGLKMTLATNQGMSAVNRARREADAHPSAGSTSSRFRPPGPGMAGFPRITVRIRALRRNLQRCLPNSHEEIHDQHGILAVRGLRDVTATV